MYASRTTQLIVGVFAALGIGAMGFLSLRLGKIELFTPPSYQIYANFDNVAGLKDGADIEIAGVEVGKVIGISLAQERARVTMRLNLGVKIDEDAIAAVRTRGIIGDKYIAISPGPGETYLANGSTLRQTESSFVLEDAIGQLISSPSTGDKAKSQSGGKGSDPSSIFDPVAPKATNPAK